MKVLLLQCILLVLPICQLQDGKTFRDLKLLSGSWKMESPKRTIVETWSVISEKELDGKSYGVKGNDTTLLERVTLKQTDDGIFYIPVVTDQNQGKPVSFKLISADNLKFVFENKEHDFPKRIVYHIAAKDSIHAWVEGNGKKYDYYFLRVR